jgi:hypothetical protein
MLVVLQTIREAKPLMAWYEVQRRYVVTENAYVQAPTAEMARKAVDEGKFYDTDEPMIERYFKAGAAKRVSGIPRTMWKAAGYPDDVPLKT